MAWALVGASALVLLGSLLPWVDAVTAFGTISIAGTDVDGVITLIAALVVGAIGAALLMGKRPRLWAYIVVLLAGLLCAFVGIYDLADVSRAAGSDFARVSPGAGLWITAIASVALLVVAVQLTRKRPRPSPTA